MTELTPENLKYNVRELTTDHTKVLRWLQKAIVELSKHEYNNEIEIRKIQEIQKLLMKEMIRSIPTEERAKILAKIDYDRMVQLDVF